jgi:hypothetical protein
MEWQRRLRHGVVPATKVKDASDDFQPREKGDCNYANNSPCPDQYERQTLQNGLVSEKCDDGLSDRKEGASGIRLPFACV